VVTGSCDADVILAGPANPMQMALGYANISGGVANCSWRANGKVGTVIVRGAVSTWSLNDDGGGLTGLATLILGPVASASIDVDGTAGVISAKEWLAGSIHADVISSLVTAGDRVAKLPGDFGADLTVDGPSNPRLASLGYVGVAGSLVGGAWDVTGKTGGLSISRFQAPLAMLKANVAWISSTSPLIRVMGNGVPEYLVAVGDDGTAYPIQFSSLASWPRTISDYGRGFRGHGISGTRYLTPTIPQ
jgi:hypothetical protein